MFAAAGKWLERNVEAINAINVFPVPDGDTGTNMFLTMRSTLDEAQKCTDEGAGPMLAAMSHGALMGARGNSGVILSQIIRGMAEALEGRREVDAAALAGSLEQAASAAYRAVSSPTEGTILTVIRDVARAVRERAEEGAELESLVMAAVEEARESVARTPTLLPVLREAGVVDAGGQGLCTLLEGMQRYLRGEPLPSEAAPSGEAVTQEWLSVLEQRHDAEPSLYGYCTEFLVSGRGLSVNGMRDRIAELGDSVLVVGGDRMLRVHVHTDDPGAALSLGTQVGSLLQVKVDNISRQAEQFVRMHEERRPPVIEPGTACTVAVAAGAGMEEVFRSMGCSAIVSGGPTMNPSTRDIVEAVDSCPSDDVIVLPNDKNIIMAAQQAAGLTQKRLHVVRSRSIPQGIAALLAMSPDEDVEENVRAMEEALGSIRTIEITRAVRSTTIRGVRVDEGQVIAIVDDELRLAAQSPEEAVNLALEGLAGDGTSLVTLYYGADTAESQASALAAELKERFPGHEVEVVHGGQPHYSYIVSLE